VKIFLLNNDRKLREARRQWYNRKNRVRHAEDYADPVYREARLERARMLYARGKKEVAGPCA
jgi:hypothetical protein